MQFDEIAQFLQFFLLFALIFQAAATDLLKRKVYNLPVVVAISGGLVLAGILGGVGRLELAPAGSLALTLLDSVMGMAVLFCPFFLAYLTGGMGAGDAKLGAGIGALAGLRLAFWILFYTAFAGAILAIIFLIFKRDFTGGLRRSLKATALIRSNKQNIDAPKPITIPYAVAMCAGTLYAFCVEILQLW